MNLPSSGMLASRWRCRSSFTGRLFGIIAETNTAGVRVDHSYQTNATLIEGRWCEFIREHSLRIGVSVDGPEFLHDLHRKTRGGRGTFERVMRGIENLRRAEIDFHVITVLTRDALDYPDELFDFYSSNEIATVAFNVEEIEGPHQSSSLQVSDAYTKFTTFMSRFYDLVEQDGHRISVREFNSAMSALMWRGKERLVKSQQINPFEIISVDVQGNFSTFSPNCWACRARNTGILFLGTWRRRVRDRESEAKSSRRSIATSVRGVRALRTNLLLFQLLRRRRALNRYLENGRFDSTETMFCRFEIKAVFDVVLSKVESALAANSARPPLV